MGYNVQQEEQEQRRRYLRNKVDFFEKMAKHNYNEGNGQEWQYCVNQRTKFVIKLEKLNNES